MRETTARRTFMSHTFDTLIIGGGSAGCVLAGRLSEDPAVSVALLEAGGRGDGTLITMPLAVIAMLPTKINNWAFETVPQAGLNGRRGYQPRGRALGIGAGPVALETDSARARLPWMRAV